MRFIMLAISLILFLTHLVSGFAPNHQLSSRHQHILYPQARAIRLSMAIEDSDMDILRKRIMRQETQYTMLLLEQSKYNPEDDTDPDEDKLPLPESVFIILFLPETPLQHVHTIEFPKGSGNNILLAFEDENECNAFADMLVKDMGFKDPCVSETFCSMLKLQCCVTCQNNN